MKAEWIKPTVTKTRPGKANVAHLAKLIARYREAPSSFIAAILRLVTR